MPPLFVGAGRAVIAAVLATAALVTTKQHPPRGDQWARLAVVAAGVVVGFPMLTAFALTGVPANHGAVIIALLPAATAVVAALRGHERPPAQFWLMAIIGAASAVVFAVLQGNDLGGLHGADLLLFGAVVAAATGYTEGGILARELGAWQTVSWALVISFPLMLTLTGISMWRQFPHGTATQWAAFGYLGAVSMFLGFFAWYRGLAIGPMTQVSQIQLAQPVMSICWAAWLLGEQLTWSTVGGGVAVIACAATGVRARLRKAQLISRVEQRRDARLSRVPPESVEPDIGSTGHMGCHGNEPTTSSLAKSTPSLRLTAEPRSTGRSDENRGRAVE